MLIQISCEFETLKKLKNNALTSLVKLFLLKLACVFNNDK